MQHPSRLLLWLFPHWPASLGSCSERGRCHEVPGICNRRQDLHEPHAFMWFLQGPPYNGHGRSMAQRSDRLRLIIQSLTLLLHLKKGKEEQKWDLPFILTIKSLKQKMTCILLVPCLLPSTKCPQLLGRDMSYQGHVLWADGNSAIRVAGARNREVRRKWNIERAKRWQLRERKENKEVSGHKTIMRQGGLTESIRRMSYQLLPAFTLSFTGALQLSPTTNTHCTKEIINV